MTNSTITVQFVASESEIPDELWDAVFPAPLEGRWWYRMLENSGINDQFRFSYGVISVDSSPIGIAPVFIMDAPVDLVMPALIARILRFAGRAFPSLRYQRMLFIGSPCADEGTVGLRPNVNRAAIFNHLHSVIEQRAREIKARVIVWKDFPIADRKPLEIVAKTHGLFRLESFPGTILPLQSNDKAKYFAGLKGSRRHQVRKKLKMSHARVALNVEVSAEPDEPTLGEVYGLFWQTYEKSRTKFERLTPEFFSIAAHEPSSRFVLLRAADSGELVAFMLCFHVGSRVINKFIGFDYARPKEWLLYFRLWEAALDWALSVNADSLQSGQTGYAAKIEVGHQLIRLTNYCKHRNPIVNAIYRIISRSITWKTLDPDLARFLLAHPEAAA